MNPYATPQSNVGAPPSDSQNKEAPSSMVTACRIMIRWQLALAIMFSCMAALVAWMSLLIRSYLTTVQNNFLRPETKAQTLMGAAVWLIALCAAGNAWLAFRSFFKLRKFRVDRRISVLHSAMKSLRLQWLVFSISLAIVVLVLTIPSLMELLEVSRDL